MNMGKIVRTLGVLIAMFIVAGCSAHSPFIVKDTTDTEVVSKRSYPPHQNEVFLTEQPLPPDCQAEVIATIQVGKIWYGDAKNIYESLANRARELGADGVVEMKTWHQPSGFSWAAPHGSGKAVKLDDTSVFKQLTGEWR
ncbi:MAG: hypothetical protein CSA20_06165 [Deltaproteobacteria bacterium]|nr:MAG: hypothetical protein CSA20_06165 [Deltaproteobacteria bacterium]